MAAPERRAAAPDPRGSVAGTARPVPAPDELLRHPHGRREYLNATSKLLIDEAATTLAALYSESASRTRDQAANPDAREHPRASRGKEGDRAFQH